MKTTTLLPERDYKITDNNLYVISERPITSSTYCYNIKTESVYKTYAGKGFDNTDWRIIEASTANLEGVKQLDRTLFVKKEDVEELADNDYHKSDIINLQQAVGFKLGWYAGYNTKKGEFEYSHILDAVTLARTTDLTVKEIAEKLRPLSLPTSIIVDESYNVIKVNW